MRSPNTPSTCDSSSSCSVSTEDTNFDILHLDDYSQDSFADVNPVFFSMVNPSKRQRTEPFTFDPDQTFHTYPFMNDNQCFMLPPNITSPSDHHNSNNSSQSDSQNNNNIEPTVYSVVLLQPQTIPPSILHTSTTIAMASQCNEAHLELFEEISEYNPITRPTTGGKTRRTIAPAASSPNGKTKKGKKR